MDKAIKWGKSSMRIFICFAILSFAVFQACLAQSSTNIDSLFGSISCKSKIYHYKYSFKGKDTLEFSSVTIHDNDISTYYLLSNVQNNKCFKLNIYEEESIIYDFFIGKSADSLILCSILIVPVKPLFLVNSSINTYIYIATHFKTNFCYESQKNSKDKIKKYSECATLDSPINVKLLRKYYLDNDKKFPAYSLKFNYYNNKKESIIVDYCYRIGFICYKLKSPNTKEKIILKSINGISVDSFISQNINTITLDSTDYGAIE